MEHKKRGGEVKTPSREELGIPYKYFAGDKMFLDKNSNPNFSDKQNTFMRHASNHYHDLVEALERIEKMYHCTECKASFEAREALEKAGEL